jgi:sugar lactone lactonase YvrE
MMNTLLKLSARVLKSALAGNRSLPDHCRSMSSLPLKMAAAAFLAGVCAAWSVPAAWAQVGFAGAQVTLGSSFDNPESVAVDRSGNVFVADTGNSAVKEILAVNGSIPANPTINTLGSGFNQPIGVPVDASGNVFVADTGNSAVKEILAVNGSIPANPTINTLGSGFGPTFGVAVDGNGNVYVADATNNAVKEILAVGGSIPASSPTINTLGSGFNRPTSVAADGNGNVFVSDFGNSLVKEILAVGGSIAASSPTINTLGSGSNQAEGMAVDGSGNIFLADFHASSVKEILAVDGSIPATNPTVNTLGSGFDLPIGLAVDARGDVFVADGDTSSVVELQTENVNFGNVKVCPTGQTSPAPCSNTLSLTFNISAGTTIGSIKVLTLGAPNLDFQPQANDTSTTLCIPQTYPSATTCTVNVTFAPLAAGARSGAVQILDGSGNVLASTSIYGTGTAPAIAFSPASQLSLVGGTGVSFGQPAGVAINGSGNLFVADFKNDAVYEMLAAGGYTTVKNLSGTPDVTFGGPAGVAVDGAGNVFVADFNHHAVYEMLATGGYTTVNTLGGGFAFGLPSDVALDASGNVFVADGDSAVYEILAAGGYTTVLKLASGFSFAQPSGLAVDSSGNVFVSDVAKVAVYEILAAGGYTTVNQLASSFGFKNLLGVAVDAGGNVFVADGNFTNIFEILATSGYTTVLSLGSGFGSPQSVAVDASGNVYVPDGGAAGTVPPAIQVIQRSQPPALGFATTGIGSTSSDSPKSVQVENVGNQPLSGTGTLGDTTDFTIVPGPDVVPDCDGVLSLTPGALCNISFNFTPQSAGLLSSTLTLSDNALNGNPAIQTIPLSGTGTFAPQISSISPNYGAPAALTTITGNHFGATQGTGSVTVGGAPSHIVSWSNTLITIQVPSKATTGNIVVISGGVSSNGAAFTFYPYPDITGFSPANGPVGTSVTITGTGLLDGGNKTTVTFNGTPAAIASDTAGSIRATVPTGATTGPISVFVNGITVKTTSSFTVTSALLNISGITPNYGAPAALIKIAGAGFGATQRTGSVTVGGAPSHVVSWSNTLITIQVPSKATTGNIVVISGGVSSNGVPFTFYPYPGITGFSPTSGPVGTPVTITGAGLLDGGNNAAVTFNGTPAVISSDTAGSIQATVPTGATTGPISVFVNGITVKSTSFTVTSSLFSISGVSPNYGAPAALINIAGTGFGATQGNGSVTVGGAPSHIVSWSSTLITIQVPSKATTGNIVVISDGVSSNGVAFTFYPYPAITGFSPTSGPVGTPVTVTGTGLLDGDSKATVNFNGTPAVISSDSAGSIQVTVPAGATSGPISVFVNGISVKSTSNFTVATPEVGGISPNYGAPASLIAITGTNFGATQGNSYVTINGALCGVTAWSDTSITIRVPSNASTGNLVVTAGGETSNSAAFTFYLYPAITTVSPESGAVGAPVTITGSNLLDGGNNATVTFNGIPAVISSDTSGSIQVTVPTGATSGRMLVSVNGVALIATTDFLITP